MLTLFTVLIASLLNSPKVSAAELWQVPRDRVYVLGLEGKYFDTKANYLTDGSSRTLANGSSLQNAQGEFNASYEMLRDWRLTASATYGQTTASNGTVTRSNAGINELSLGGQYWLRPEGFYLVPQVRVAYPIWRVNEQSDAPLIGDGSARFEGGALGIWRLEMFQPFASLGYVYRDVGRASLLNYSVGGYWRPSRWWLQGEFRGYTSVSKDSDSDQRSARDVLLLRVDGGSSRFASVNPSLNEVAIDTGFYLGRGWKLYGGFSMPISGSDSANGFTVAGGVSFGSRLGGGGSGSRATPIEEESGGMDPKRFRPQSEEYDESLFLDERGSGSNRVKKKVRKTPSVDKLLNETERELNQK